MNMKIASWSKSKLLLFGAGLFLSSLFFGGQAKALTCTWTASTSLYASVMTNWDNGSGAACPGLTNNIAQFNGATSNTSSIWDLTTTTQGIFFSGNYSGSVTVTSGVTLTTVSDVTQNVGTFNLASGGTLTVGGNLGVSSTAFTASGTLNVAGNIIATTTINQPAGTLTLSGTSKTVSGAGTILLNNVNITASTSFASNVTSTGDITLSGSGSLNLGGTVLSTSGSITNNGISISQVTPGTVTMTGNSKKVGGTGNTTFYNLYLNDLTSLIGDVTTTNNLTVVSNLTGTTSTVDYNLVVGGNLTANSSFQMDNGYGHGHLTMTGSGKTLSGTGTFALKSLTINSGASVTTYGSLQINATTTVAGTLNAATSSLTLYGEGSGALSVSGTFNPNTSTITFNGVGPVIPGSTYYNLIVGPSSSGTSTFNGNVTSTNLTVNSASAILNLGSNNLVVTGNLTNTLGTVTQTAGTVTMTSSSAFLGGAGSTTLADLSVTGTTTLAGNVFASTTVISGVLNGAGKTLTITGAGTPFVINGTFNANTSTVMYYTAAGTVNIASTTFYNLTLANAGVSNSAVLTGNVTTTNNFSVGVGVSLGMGAYNAVVSSSFANSGTVTQSSGTLTMSGVSTLGGSGNTTLYNVIAANNTTLAGNVTTTNTFTVNATKNADLSTYTLRLTATGTPLIINGTFTASTSTVVYSGSDVNIASTTFYNLTLNSSVSSTMVASTTVSNTLTISNGVLYEPGNDYLTLSGTGTVLDSSSAAHLSTTSQRLNVSYAGTGINVAPATYYNLKIDSSSSTLAGNVTITNNLIISSGKTLNGGSATVTLNTNTGNVFQNSGTFNAGTSNIYYNNSSATVATGTYYTLTLGTGTYSLGGIATSSNSFTNGGNLSLGAYNLISSGTHTNSGTITHAGAGNTIKQATGGMDTTSYTSGSANGTGNTITISVTDYASNYDASTAETKTVSLTSASNLNDSESITLTETGVATGIFSATIPFYITNAATNDNSKVDVSGNGTLTLSYSNGYGALSGSGTSASYTGSSFSSGGAAGGGSGSSPSVSSATTAATVSAGTQTTSQTVTLSLSATNAAQVALSEDPGFAGASWLTYSPTQQFTLSKGAGEKTIYVKFRSAAGGVTDVYKVKVTLKEGYVSAPVATKPATTVASVTPVVATTQFEVSNADSKVVISPIKTLVYKPNSVVKYTYSYKNETAKTVKVQVVRSVIDTNGKVVAKVTGSTTLTKGKTAKFNTSNLLNSKLADGTYTIKVQVLDVKGTVLDENSFNVSVQRPLPPPAIVTNNPGSKVVITGVQMDYKPGGAVKYTYSYKNETAKPLKITIVRQVVDTNGKVVNQVSGARTLSKGQSIKFNATSALNSKLAAGTYTVKVQILDAKKVMIDENSFDTIVKK